MKYPRTNNAYHKSRRDNSDRIDALLAECEKMEDELAAQGKLERELAAVTEQRDRMQSKIENQAERIKYLEGATNHATGTPLSKMREQRDRLAEALRELCETLLNDKPRDITESLYKAGDALAAWKGGSDDKQTTKDETEDGSPKVGTPPRRRERRER